MGCVFTLFLLPFLVAAMAAVVIVVGGSVTLAVCMAFWFVVLLIVNAFVRRNGILVRMSAGPDWQPKLAVAIDWGLRIGIVATGILAVVGAATFVWTLFSMGYI